MLLLTVRDRKLLLLAIFFVRESTETYAEEMTMKEKSTEILGNSICLVTCMKFSPVSV